ncbi:hypothetical protein CSV75_01605 [Sporosarcina sp. P18a]|uniref:DUF771 domain-containing protein n=1 Tax=Sporosarcina sp. P18a TaxID=2048259 RepID=UPI000C164EE1|nr:DUF771 domain-containing protein [Sporosarcina sp. P18a]PIC80515.1 hypothetical protein CSV75_01605 [Sporosarcina sp. P18a]
MQQLNVNLSIDIPSDYVLISKIELEDLQKEQLLGTYWTMKDLEVRTSKKQVWLKENLLYVPRLKESLDVKNGGFVYYPSKSGEKWSFQASEMAKFLDKNFCLIFGGK